MKEFPGNIYISEKASLGFKNALFDGFFSYVKVKRVADFLLSVFLLITLSPLLILLAIAVYLETGENPVFTQQRGLTLKKYRFKIYKLRTLKNAGVETVNKGNDIFIKNILRDRVTLIGGWLRRTGLDELPQLINVLKGEMSFIGPRPLSLEDLGLMREQSPYEYSSRETLQSLPGITGYWQIFGDRSKGAKNLIELEMKYEKEKSVLLDLFLVALTVPVVLFGRHADAIRGHE